MEASYDSAPARESKKRVPKSRPRTRCYLGMVGIWSHRPSQTNTIPIGIRLIQPAHAKWTRHIVDMHMSTSTRDTVSTISELEPLQTAGMQTVGNAFTCIHLSASLGVPRGGSQDSRHIGREGGGNRNTLCQTLRDT